MTSPRDSTSQLTVLETQIAVRAYVPRSRPKHTRPLLDEPELILVLDTETRTDAAQALTFGSYRIYEAGGRLRQEGLIHGDGLSEAELAPLRQYVHDHAADNDGHLRLRSRREFLRQVFWPIAYEARALVVGFNLPFDLSRLAFGWRPARNGGFTLQLFESIDADGRLWPDQFRPEIRVKALDSKRNFISFTAFAQGGRQHLADGQWYRGRFLDLRTLAYALTDRSMSLAGAGTEFGLEVTKESVKRHGVITAEHVDYNRQDVRATWALYQALTGEWRRHPIALAPEQAHSPAAVSKDYLALLGVTPPDGRSDVPVERVGLATTAYYGGRTECRIRGVPLPVRYVDFSSMYPTVFALLGLWGWVTAGRLTSVDWTEEARALLDALDREALHDPGAWPEVAGVFCRIRPAGELLPVRARYGADPADPASGSLAWTIGLNELEADTDLWYSLADLVAAKLLGARSPVILEAFRVAPSGRQPGLRTDLLRGSVRVDPTRDDLFRRATEERARVRRDAGLPEAERVRLGQFLKTLANGGSYGLFAEVRQLDRVRGGKVVAAHGLWPIEARVTTPEEPGLFSFPPLAATITGAARLLLALAQADVEALGGSYVACDTDSLLIVASEAGGLLACPGGPEQMPDGGSAVRALRWDEVYDVLAGLNALNPYAPGTVSSLVKLEDENFAVGEPKAAEELYCLATSSKRYVLYNRAPDGGVVLRKPSEHGLGMYRSPLEPRDEWTQPWREWIDVVWRRTINAVEGRDPGPEPAWYDLPAVGQLPVSSPAVLEPFRAMNADQSFATQVKPFGFLLLGHVDPLAAMPAGLAPGDVTPIAPFTNKPEELLALPWRNRRDGRPLRVTTKRGGARDAVRLQTYGDAIAAYRVHPEHKSGDPRGGLGRRGSVGLLPRLRVRVAGLPVHIGKESNRLDDVQDGFVDATDEVYVEYRDERREWEAALPALRQLRKERGNAHLMRGASLSERAVRDALNRGRMPHRAARGRLIRLLRPAGTAMD